MTDFGPVLWHIFIVLVVAKAAAEVAERAGLPVVVAEIVAGMIIGPSIIGLVATDEVLLVLGELGVILLLLEVGLEMELTELLRVGRASLLVALVGVTLPFIAGYAVAFGFGQPAQTAVFVGAALTATSVGITARVFSDLRALTRIEARTVLGAAVADDVLGLVILTVVLKIATAGSITLLQVAGVLGLAIAFLLVAGAVGLRFADPFLTLVRRFSRSNGTFTSISLAFALGLAILAGAAGLAPIVGAFIAGMSLAGASQADRVRRELAPVGHLLIPVFFLQIGIDVKIDAFADPRVLALGGALLLVAIGGKILAALGALGTPGDKLLIGLGMMPRGEVGLIFASLGLRAGIIGPQLYAALLLVVLVTTLITPPVLRHRLARSRRAVRGVSTSMPVGGWLQVADGVVELVAEPPRRSKDLEIVLRAAFLGAEAKPGPGLLDWISSLDTTSLAFDDVSKELFFELLRTPSVRSWRFVEMTGVLERALPELAEAISKRGSDRSELDPTHALRWKLVEGIHDVVRTDLAARVAAGRLTHPEWLYLAGLIVDFSAGDPSAVAISRKLVRRLDLGAAAEQEMALLVGQSGLLRAAAGLSDATEQGAVIKLAAQIGSIERCRALYLLGIALGEMDSVRRARLDELFRLIEKTLADPELSGRSARNLIGRKRAAALRITGDVGPIADRVGAAPEGYVMSIDAQRFARHAHMLESLPAKGRARVEIEPTGADGWIVDVSARDRTGLLAWTTKALAARGIEVERCVIATWPDGGAIQSFEISTPTVPDPARLAHDIEGAIGSSLEAEAMPEQSIEFDNEGSPWYTLCEVAGPDRRGLLHALTTAMSVAGATIHSARIITVGGRVLDRFELSTPAGEKLPDGVLNRIRANLQDGVAAKSARHRTRRLRGVDLQPG
jgi:Kef-type K+ transport system membrane component KefB/glycine cleavage system regulatory protein